MQQSFHFQKIPGGPNITIFLCENWHEASFYNFWLDIEYCLPVITFATKYCPIQFVKTNFFFIRKTNDEEESFDNFAKSPNFLIYHYFSRVDYIWIRVRRRLFYFVESKSENLIISYKMEPSNFWSVFNVKCWKLRERPKILWLGLL